MEKNELPCLYHPTTVVLVDDDINFLKNTTLNLDPDIAYKTYNDPLEALKFVEKLKDQNKSLSRVISLDDPNEECSEKTYPLSLKISSILDEAYDKNQYGKVSVLLVDHAMPQMSGGDFFEKIADIPIKKVMLTGQADEAFAVKLFNARIIDRFIMKGDNSLGVSINRVIHELQKEYFQDISNTLLRGLPFKKTFTLADPEFVTLFNNIRKEAAATSFYLIDMSGSFIFMDSNGAPSWLLVSSKSDAYQFAKQAEVEGASKEIVKDLKNGKKISYFNNFDEYIHATEGHWENYLYDAKKLGNAGEYFYTLVQELPGFPIKKNKILSYNEYLRNNSD